MFHCIGSKNAKKKYGDNGVRNLEEEKTNTTRPFEKYTQSKVAVCSRRERKKHA